MSKKANTPAVVEPVELSKLDSYLLTTEQMIDEAKNIMILDSIGSEEKMNQIIESYSNLAINGIQDMATYKIVNSAIYEVKKMRTSLEKRRKELTSPAINFQKALIEAENEITPRLKELEEKLKSEKTRIDDAREAATRELYTKRVGELSAVGYQLANGFFMCGAFQVPTTQVTEFNDEEFEFYINEGKKEQDRQKAEELRKAEQQRLLDEQRDELQKLRDELQAERIALAKEREQLAAERAENEAQKTALEETYETVVQPPVAEHPVQQIEPPVQLFASSVKPNQGDFDGPMMGDEKPEIQNTSDKIRSSNIEPLTPTFDEIPSMTVSTEFNRGFEACIVGAVNILKKPEIKTRAEIIAAIQGLKPEVQ